MPSTETDQFLDILSIVEVGYYTHTTDDDFVVPQDVSYIEWNVVDQSADRNIILPTIGNGPGELAPGRYIQVSNLESNGFSIQIGPYSFDSDSRYLFTVTPAGLFGINIEFGANAYTSGSAGSFNIGTSGGTVPLNNGNITRSGTTTFNEDVTVQGTRKLFVGTGLSYFTRAFGGALPGFDYIMPSGGVLRVTTAGVYGANDVFFQPSPPTGSEVVFESGNNANLYLGPGNSGKNVYLATARVIRARANDSGFAIGRGATEGTEMRGVYHGTTPALVAGSTVVTAAWVTAGTRIFMQAGTESGTPGVRYSRTISAGASFTITSKDALNATQILDTSTVDWYAVVP